MNYTRHGEFIPINCLTHARARFNQMPLRCPHVNSEAGSSKKDT